MGIKVMFDIIKLPFRLLLFVSKLISYKILDKDFEEEREKTLEAYREIGKLRREVEQLTKEKEQIISKQDRLKSVFKCGCYNRNVFLSDKNELIVVCSNEENFFNDWVYLFAENGKHHHNDSRIALKLTGKKLKIKDFISNTENKGYGRILLGYVIEKAFNYDIETIYGDLSDVDKNNFDWLIPFYKSIGFQVTIYDNPKTIMQGKIEMTKSNYIF